MILSASFFCLCLLILSGVCADGDEVKSVCVTEGDSVSLHTDVTEVQSKDQILWMFGPQETRIAELHKLDIDMFDSNETFGNRLQMDSQTGSLTITDIRSEHTGLYKLEIRSKRGNSNQRFNVTVYARLPVLVITSNSSQCSSSSSSSSSSESRCAVVCSAVNVSHVTLSWYKGNSLLSSISVSDLSISLSLPLEVEYQDNNTYSCVVSYSFTNRTTHLNNTGLCHPCPAVNRRSGLMRAVSVSLALLVLIAGAAGLRYHRNCRQTVQTEEEMHYADPAFLTHPLQSTDVVAEDLTVYSTVKT